MFGKSHSTVPAARLEVLRRLPMFAHFSDHELATVDGLVCQMILAPGATLVSQGKPGREAFIVVSGSAEVSIDGEVVARAAAGDVVGEMALLDNRPRTATVVATTPLEVLVLDPRQWAELLEDPRTSRWIATVLASRLRSAEVLESVG